MTMWSEIRIEKIDPCVRDTCTIDVTRQESALVSGGGEISEFFLDAESTDRKAKRRRRRTGHTGITGKPSPPPTKRREGTMLESVFVTGLLFFVSIPWPMFVCERF